MNFTDAIPNIVNGFDMNKGDLILLQFWGENAELEVLDLFAVEIGRKGCIPIKWQHSREFLRDYFSNSPIEALEFPDKYFEVFKAADSVVDICMYAPSVPHKDFPKEKFDLYRNYMRKLFGTVTNNKKLFIQIRVPSLEASEDAGIDYELYKESINNALMVDYDVLKTSCNDLVEKLQGRKQVEIYTDNGAKLDLSLGERQWLKDDGNGDIPCGEIYIAPM